MEIDLQHNLSEFEKGADVIARGSPSYYFRRGLTRHTGTRFHVFAAARAVNGYTSRKIVFVRVEKKTGDIYAATGNVPHGNVNDADHGLRWLARMAASKK